MTTDSWQNTSSGSWNASANWSDGAPPTLSDAAQITDPGTYTVAINSGIAEAGSLLIKDSGATVTDTAELELGGMLALSAGTFELQSGGVISGGTIATFDSGSFVANGGTLEAVTYDGTLNVGSKVDLTISSGITFAGSGGTGSASVDLASGSELTIAGTTVLDNATIMMNGFGFQSAALNFDDLGASDTLTLGSSLSLDIAGNTAAIEDPGHSGTLVNSGSITVAAGDIVSIEGFATVANAGNIVVGSNAYVFADTRQFENRGAISVSSGVMFAISGKLLSPLNPSYAGVSGTFANSGTIAVSSGGTLVIAENLSADALAGIAVSSGGALVISGGVLDNAGLTFSAGSGMSITNLELAGATIRGGTIVGDGGFTTISGQSVLSAVTIDGTLDMSNSASNLYVYGGLTVNNLAGNGPGTIDLNGNLFFNSTTTLNNVTIDDGGYLDIGSGTLTFGANVQLLQIVPGFEAIGGPAFVNSGSIDLPAYYYTSFTMNFDTIVNDGGITVGSGNMLKIDNASSFSGSGTLDLQSGARLNFTGGYFDPNGPLIASAGGQIIISANTIVTSAIGVETGGTLEISADSYAYNASNVISSADGNIEISGGVEIIHDTTVDAAVYGVGTFQISRNMTFVSGVGSHVSIDFANSYNYGSVTIEDPMEFNGTIDGFQWDASSPYDYMSDELILSTVPYNSGGTIALTSSNVLEVTENGTTYDFQLDPHQSYTASYFHLEEGTGGDTIVFEADENSPCYCRGTLILTDHGERPVETVQIGDRLVTLSGDAKPIRWIGRRAYSGIFIRNNPDVLPVRIRAGAIAPGVPKRDLFVSPNHAMYLEGMLIPAIALVDGDWITRAQSVESVEYFHLELESHDVILAEGAWSESFVDDHSRNMFQNAAEYRALYPDLADRPAIYCAPRIEDGEALEAIRANLAARRTQVSQRAPAELTGHLDLVRRDLIEGWAYDFSNPRQPVRLRLIDNGVTLGEIEAGQFRWDLRKSSVGDGWHSFSFVVPHGLGLDQDHIIQIVRAEDGTELPGSPVRWQPGRSHEAETGNWQAAS